jgi:hypothetical protein
VIILNFSSPSCIVSVSSGASSLPVTRFCYRLSLRSTSLIVIVAYGS